MTQFTDERIAHLVRVLERRFRRDLEKRLEAHGVHFGHWEFLRILWKDEGLSQRELSDRAGLTTPTTHTAILKMEALGLVMREVPEGAIKRPVVYLTERGRSLETILVKEAVAANALATKGLDVDAIEALRATLIQMIDNLQND